MKVLITGATGSLGRALVRRLIDLKIAETIVAFSRGEWAQAMLAEELGQPKELKWMIGDIRDVDRVADALSRVDTVLHCAALKRLDLAANDPLEIFKTNLVGTANIVRAAVRRNVPRILVVSSDKAAASSTVYGTSKAAAEAIAVHANMLGHPQVRVSATRWGNVLTSRGAAVHLWRRQVARGEPVTITDSRMTRFIITMADAVEFLLRALHEMRGGEIFVPVLPSARIVDLADAVAASAAMKIIGLRADGEKIHETLVSEDEVPRTVVVSGLGYVIQPARPTWPYTPWRGNPLSGPYRSDTNPDWLEPDQIRRMLAEVPEEP